MLNFNITKQLQEEITFYINTSGLKEIQRGELISSLEVITANPEIVIRTEISTPFISIRLGSGVLNKIYKITLIVITNLNHRRKLNLFLTILDS